MKKFKLSAILIVATIISSIYSCSNRNTLDNQKEISINMPYYSITTAKSYHYSNYYVDIDVKIPKISYTNVSSDELFDSINNEIYTTITELIDSANDNSLTTFKTYLETAKNNIINDRNKKIEALKDKYREVIGENEENEIAKIYDIATDNNIYGHTSSDNLIIPELHNKKIIVVETTESTNETKEYKSTEMPEDTYFQNKSTKSNLRPKRENSDDKRMEFQKNQFRSTTSDIKKSERKEIIEENKDIDYKNTISTFSVATEEITIENFYKELNSLKNDKIPSDVSLARAYTPTKITCNFDVKCLDEDYISLFIELDNLKTVNSVKRLFYNIDLNQKKIIKIKDILGDDYKSICISNINKAIEGFDENKKSTLKQNYNIEDFINEDTAFFINNNHIPVVELDKFAINPGYLEFQIIK